jgi:sodium/bile acid cotransporter 7
MFKPLKAAFEPYILLLMGMVVLATVLPPRGPWVRVFDLAADASIVLLFFLQGAKLSREAIIAGIGNWRLHLAVFAATYAMFPVLGIGMSVIPGLNPQIAAGMLFLTLLPSTVQSSIAFTSIARGNVAAAVCSASFSNLIGIALTPVLVALLMSGSNGMGGISFASVQTILFQLLLPFVTGHLLRPWIGGFVSRNTQLISYTDRGSILLVVFTAFGAAVVAGLWSKVPVPDLALIVMLSSVLLALVLFLTWFASRALGFPREDAIVLLFCGSKKSLATGVPMASVLFPAAQVGVLILPLMIFHQIQLIVCAVIARRFADAPD